VSQKNGFGATLAFTTTDTFSRPTLRMSQPAPSTMCRSPRGREDSSFSMAANFRSLSWSRATRSVSFITSSYVMALRFSRMMYRIASTFTETLAVTKWTPSRAVSSRTR
jgi:hypothetical protein